MAADPKSKAKWAADKQQAYDHLLADLVRRIDALDATKGDASLVLKLQIHRGAYQSGRFDADTEYA